MERRSFLAGLSALFLAPRPTFVMAGGPSAELYAKAKFLARAHNKSSVPMLMRHLKVDAEIAAQINSMLFQRGVITAPIGGTSLALHPTNTHALPLDAPKQMDRLAQLRDFAERLLDRDKSSEVVADEDAESSEDDLESPKKPPS